MIAIIDGREIDVDEIEDFVIFDPWKHHIYDMNLVAVITLKTGEKIFPQGATRIKEPNNDN